MLGRSRFVSIALTPAFLFLTVLRSPAPVQELSDSPTPAPEQSPAAKPIRSPSGEWDGEVFPETRTHLLTRQEIATWDADKLRYAINEIYARGGYDFRIPAIKQAFMRFQWYRSRLVNGRSQDEAVAHLSPLERKNLEFLQNVRGKKE